MQLNVWLQLCRELQEEKGTQWAGKWMKVDVYVYDFNLKLIWCWCSWYFWWWRNVGSKWNWWGWCCSQRNVGGMKLQQSCWVRVDGDHWNELGGRVRQDGVVKHIVVAAHGVQRSCAADELAIACLAAMVCCGWNIAAAVLNEWLRIRCCVCVQLQLRCE